MAFYFGTKSQIDGDFTYNKGNFEKALEHYKKGLETLQQVKVNTLNAAKKFQYEDAYTYVCGEIIVTLCKIKGLALLDYTDYEELRSWGNSTFELVEKMQSSLKEMNQKRTNRTSSKFIKNVYVTLATVCELMSDGLLDTIDMEKIPQEKAMLDKAMLLEAIQWMQEAISYSENTDLSAQCNRYLGLLNMYERLGKLEQNPEIFAKMSQLLQKPPVDIMQGDTLQRLEWFAHALSVAIHLNQKNRYELASQSQAVLMELDADERRDSLLVTEINFFLKKLKDERPVNDGITLLRAAMHELNDERPLNDGIMLLRAAVHELDEEEILDTDQHMPDAEKPEALASPQSPSSSSSRYSWHSSQQQQQQQMNDELCSMDDGSSLPDECPIKY